MKNILCFGDSLTWGFNPSNGTRYSYSDRWAGVLQKKLGNDYHVIEGGLNGRTTAWKTQATPDRSGLEQLPFLLESHAPLDLVVIFLGTNDLNVYAKRTAIDAATGCMRLMLTALKSMSGPNGLSPKILLLSPPHIIEPKNFMDTIFAGMEAESRQFALHYRRVADFSHIHFLDTAPFIKPSKADGIHLDAEENHTLAKEVAKKMKHIGV